MTMRHFMLIVAFLAVSGSALSHANAAAQIPWETDFEAALQEAHAQNRPLLLHFWTPECVPCRRLEQKVFNQARVVDTMRDFFIPVKVNANEHPELAARYKIETVPTDVIVSPNREELHQLCTPQDPDQYVAQLSAIAFRTGTTANPAATPGRSTREAVAKTATPRVNARGFSPESQDMAEPAARDTAAAAAEPTEVINRFASRSRKDNKTSGADKQVPAAEPASEEIAESGRPPLTGDSQSGRSRSRWSDDVDVADHPSTSPAAQHEIPVREQIAGEALDATPTTAKAAEPAGAKPGNHVARRNAPQMGLDGYCPVTLLREEKWVKGDPKFGVIHRGRTYLFASEEEKNLFWSDPDEYSPVLAGIDPVRLTDAGEAVEGRREHGVVYRKRVYLFSSEDSLERFWQDPERFASPIRQAMESGDVGRLFR